MTASHKRASLRAPSTAQQLGEFLTPLDVLRGLPGLASFRTWPRGYGQSVVVLPGYGGGDTSTWALRATLNRAGYCARGWNLGRNNGDVPGLLAKLLDQIQAQFEHVQQPLHLVGWSLGGYLAREVARELPDAVAGVVTLGSPVFGGPKYTAVARYWRSSATALDEIEQAIEQRYAKPIRCPMASIYSKRDGIVAWQASVDSRSPRIRHIEVESSHLALGFSGQVLAIVIREMAKNIRLSAQQ